MNDLGRDYIKDISKKFQEAKLVGSWSWSDSPVQERIMRLGIEAGLYELNTDNPAELEAMAIATLKEDRLRKLLPTYETPAD